MLTNKLGMGMHSVKIACFYTANRRMQYVI